VLHHGDRKKDLVRNVERWRVKPSVPEGAVVAASGPEVLTDGWRATAAILTW